MTTRELVGRKSRVSVVPAYAHAPDLREMLVAFLAMGFGYAGEVAQVRYLQAVVVEFDGGLRTTPRKVVLRSSHREGELMGSVRPGVPMTLVQQLHARLGLRAAVETGTFMGGSAVALAAEFDRVWTIELSEQLWREASVRHAAVKNITFLQGASQDVLPTVDPGGPALYWLDGHWSVGITAGEDNQCPVMQEIRAIDATPAAAGSVILIDDARQFLAPPGPPLDRSQWPSLTDVVDLLRATHDRYVTLLEDVIVAVPPAARRTVEDYGMSVAWQPDPPSLTRRVIGRARREVVRVRGSHGTAP